MIYSHYPISKVLVSLIEESGMRRSKFVEFSGYRRLAKGLRVLDAWLINGEGAPLFIERVIGAFPAWESRIREAISETTSLKAEEKEERRKRRLETIYALHKPCLLVLTDEETPSQITFYALFGERFKKVPLPYRMVELDDERAFRIIRWRIKRYLYRYQGYCLFWGTARGFLYSKKPDQNYHFAIDGTLLGKDNELPSLLKAATTASINGHKTVIRCR